MAEPRAFKGVWIPAEVWLTEELSITEKVLLTEIDSLDGDQGCFATNEYFAKFFGLSVRQISRIINDLVKKDYISSELVKGDNGLTERRVLHIKRPPYPVPYRQKCLGGVDKNGISGVDKNVQHSNTDNTNNTFIEEPPKPRFKKPTVEEVAEYCRERNNTVDPIKFWNYYESIGWTQNKQKIVNWKNRVVTWERNEKTYNKDGNNKDDEIRKDNNAYQG